jgi:ABC-2 type transport system ATP-binding protein
VRALIKKLSSEKAVVLSTHILEEVEAICTRIILISQGKVVVDESPAEFQARQPGARLDAIFASLTTSDV